MTLPTSEGDKGATEGEQQVLVPITTSTNSTHTHILHQRLRTHFKTNRAGTLTTLPPITTDDEHPKSRSRRKNPDYVDRANPIQRAKQRSHPLHQPNIVTQVAIDLLLPRCIMVMNIGTHICGIEYLCVSVVHPTAEETIISYNKLTNDEERREARTKGVGKDFGN